jgi:hypothetical protein
MCEALALVQTRYRGQLRMGTDTICFRYAKVALSSKSIEYRPQCGSMLATSADP